jgi:hypothetical protein
VGVMILRRKRMDGEHCCIMTASLAPVNSTNGSKISRSVQGVVCSVIRLSEELRVFILGHFIPKTDTIFPFSVLCKEI